MAQDTVAERHSRRIHFKNGDLDFYLLWALAHASAGGAEYGECLSAASRVDEGKPESWILAWTGLAARLEDRAIAAEAANHPVSARQAFLRAAAYQRVATLMIRPRDPRLRSAWERARTCFRRAGALLDPPIEPIVVPFREGQLFGYFLPAQAADSPRPTLLFTTGGEGWAEDAFFWVGAAGTARGYNVVGVDLPLHLGARFTNPDSSPAVLPEEPLRRIVDVLLERDDVDPKQIAIIGFSAGALFAARAAAADPRIRACILDSPIFDLYALFAAEFPPLLQRAPSGVLDGILRLAGRLNPATVIELERTCWQVGVRGVPELLEVVRPLAMNPEAITCPTLGLVGAGESAAFLSQAREFHDRLRVHSKALRVFTDEESADAHCQLNNLSLMQATVFDWLDELFVPGQDMPVEVGLEAMEF